MRIWINFLAILFICLTNVYGQDGSLDMSFSGDGIYTTKNVDASTTSFITGATLPDGSMIVGGITSRLSPNNSVASVLVNLQSDGSLNENFGTNGTVETRGSFMNKILLQKDHIIVLSDSILRKYSMNGDLVDTVYLGAGFSSQSMSVDSGAIYVCGYNKSNQTAIAKFHSTFERDTTFGDGGIVEFDIAPNSVWERCRYIVAKHGSIYGLTVFEADSLTHLDDLGVVFKLDISGQLDSNFSLDGKKFLVDPNSPFDQRLGLGFAWSEYDSSILVCGDFKLFKIKAVNGEYEQGFGENGVVRHGLNGNLWHLTTQKEGKAIICTSTIPTRFDILLLRLTVTGAVDSTFGIDGVTTTSIAEEDIAYDVLYDSSNNKIVVVGSSEGIAIDGIVCRYNSSNTLFTTAPKDMNLSVVFPNPASTKLYITLRTFDNVASNEEISISVFNTCGVKVLGNEYLANQGTVVLDVSHLAAGQYTLIVESTKLGMKAVENLIIQ